MIGGSNKQRTISKHFFQTEIKLQQPQEILYSNVINEQDRGQIDVHESKLENQTTILQIGDLIWGPARGFPAWPGKIIDDPNNSESSLKIENSNNVPSTPPQESLSFNHAGSDNDTSSTVDNDMVWVRWFGGRQSTECVNRRLLKSLSEGLDAHHSAQRAARKSRKLNSQLESAIQEAMSELDQTSLTSPDAKSKTSKHATQVRPPGRAPVKIAPHPGNSDSLNTSGKDIKDEDNFSGRLRSSQR